MRVKSVARRGVGEGVYSAAVNGDRLHYFVFYAAVIYGVNVALCVYSVDLCVGLGYAGVSREIFGIALFGKLKLLGRSHFLVG